jgi:hypothetical protein
MITWTSIRILTTVIVKLYFTRKISFPFSWSYIEHSFQTTFYLLLILTLSRNDYVIIIVNFILSRTLILAASSIMRRMLIQSQSRMLIASLYHYRLIFTSGNLLIYMQGQSIGNKYFIPFVLWKWWISNDMWSFPYVSIAFFFLKEKPFVITFVSSLVYFCYCSTFFFFFIFSVVIFMFLVDEQIRRSSTVGKEVLG